MTISLNGTACNGSPVAPTQPFPPSKIERTDTKIGTTLIADSGKRNFITRSTFKPAWTLSWSNANLTTRNFVKGVAQLNTTFAFVDEQGASWAVQCEEDDAYGDSTAFTTSAGAILYDVKLIIHYAL